LRELDWMRHLMQVVFGIPDFDPAQYRGLLFGLAMVVMMVLRPRGFVSTRMPSIFLREKKAVSGSLVKEGHG
jgi:branched-chain amino acid transport system permease protein